MKAIVLLVIAVAIITGLAILRSIVSKTAFVMDMILVFGMSFCMAFHLVGFFTGIVLSILIGTGICILDEHGILA